MFTLEMRAYPINMSHQSPQTAEVETKQSYLKFVKVGRGAREALSTAHSRVASRAQAACAHTLPRE